MDGLLSYLRGAPPAASFAFSAAWLLFCPQHPIKPGEVGHLPSLRLNIGRTIRTRVVGFARENL